MDLMSHRETPRSAPCGDWSHACVVVPINLKRLIRETYRARVGDGATDADRARWNAFARWARKAVDDARDIKGWSQPRVAAETGVSKAQLQRWMNADFRADPQPAKVNGFARALGLELDEPYRILQWGRFAPESRPAAPTQIPDAVAALLRKLQDPSVPESEKRDALRTVEWLAQRPSTPPEPPASRSRRAG
jgi:transcriptional regulator with XRE-family HTH domain